MGAAGIRPRQELITLARRLGDRGKEAEHLGWLSIISTADGRHDEAAQAADEATATLVGVPEGTAHAAMYGLQACFRLLRGDPFEAVIGGERAIALAERLGDLEFTLRGLNTVGEAWMQGGEEERGRTELERALRLAQETNREGLVAVTLANLGDNHCRVYRFERQTGTWARELPTRLIATWIACAGTCCRGWRLPACFRAGGPKRQSWLAPSCVCPPRRLPNRTNRSPGTWVRVRSASRSIPEPSHSSRWVACGHDVVIRGVGRPRRGPSARGATRHVLASRPGARRAGRGSMAGGRSGADGSRGRRGPRRSHRPSQSLDCGELAYWLWRAGALTDRTC